MLLLFLLGRIGVGSSGCRLLLHSLSRSRSLRLVAFILARQSADSRLASHFTAFLLTACVSLAVFVFFCQQGMMVYMNARELTSMLARLLEISVRLYGGG